MELIDFLAGRWSRCVTAAVAASALTLGGCALAISGPQANRPHLETPKCDTGKGGVVLDTLWAAAFGIGGLSAISNDEPEIGALVLATGALFASSALRGNSRANACVAAFDAYNAEVVAERRAPPRDDVIIPRRVARRPRVEPRPASTTPAAAAQREEPTASSPAPTPRPAPFMTPRPPAPATAPPAAAPAPRPAAAAAAAADDDWSEFWKEVP